MKFLHPLEMICDQYGKAPVANMPRMASDGRTTQAPKRIDGSFARLLSSKS